VDARPFESPEEIVNILDRITALNPGAGKVLLVEARPGAARRGEIDRWLDTARSQGATAWSLNSSLDFGGPWSGVRELLLDLYPRLRESAPELVSRHDYELTTLVPALRRQIAVRNPNLTDSAVADEKVRNYPIDRAYRIVHGLIELLEAWYRHTSERTGGRRWVIAVEGYLQAGTLQRRFFRELLRRRGATLDITLVLAVDPGEESAVLQDLAASVPASLPIDRVRLDLPADEPEPAAAPEQLSERARQMEEWVIPDNIERETHYPELIRLWRASDQPQGAVRWYVFGLGACNHRGFYEDALVYAGPVLENLDAFAGADDEMRWNIVGNIFQCLAASGRADEARRVVEEEALARIHDPRLQARIYYVMAMLHSRYLAQHDLALATDYLQRALDILRWVEMLEADRHFYIVFTSNALALVRFRQGHFQEAVDLCRAGFERLETQLEPERHRLHRSVLMYNIAQVYTAIGAREEAIEYFDRAIDMDRNYSEYYNERGNVLLKLGRPAEAERDYQRAIELSPPYPEVWTNLGQCYRMLNEPRAVGAFSRSLDLDPRQALALTGRAQALEAIGHLDEAIGDYSAALEVDPRQPMVLANRAVLHYEQGRLDDALADLDRAVALAPEIPDLYQNRAVALQDLGRADAAAEDLRTYLRLHPGAPDRAEVESRLAALREMEGAVR
jgi:tetratricopeptide (TPR) repeat protein